MHETKIMCPVMRHSISIQGLSYHISFIRTECIQFLNIYNMGLTFHGVLSYFGKFCFQCTTSSSCKQNDRYYGSLLANAFKVT
jgi:hypothetical protein